VIKYFLVLDSFINFGKVNVRILVAKDDKVIWHKSSSPHHKWFRVRGSDTRLEYWSEDSSSYYVELFREITREKALAVMLSLR
jgi:hypothetical protein